MERKRVGVVIDWLDRKKFVPNFELDGGEMNLVHDLVLQNLCLLAQKKEGDNVVRVRKNRKSRRHSGMKKVSVAKCCSVHT